MRLSPVLSSFFLFNELIWQEGLLLDFLQKKCANNWLKKAVIYTGYLFSEKLVFDEVIKFYFNSIIHPFQFFFIFELTSVANLLFINIFLFLFIFYFIVLLFFSFSVF